MDNYLPKDILGYVLEEKLEADFLTAIMLHRQNYSIAEIADREIWTDDDKCYIRSVSYGINIGISDAAIVSAVRDRKYVSIFLSKNGNDRQIHFFVHNCPVEDKKGNEEKIAEEVVQYMILKTIVTLHLNTPDKVKAYCTGNV